MRFWPAGLLLLTACAQTATITVTVDGQDTVASVGVVDRDVWYGDVPNDAGFTEIREDVALPARFEVLPGDYVVMAGQGTGSGQEEVTVEAGDEVDVALSLVFVE